VMMTRMFGLLPAWFAGAANNRELCSSVLPATNAAVFKNSRRRKPFVFSLRFGSLTTTTLLK